MPLLNSKPLDLTVVFVVLLLSFFINPQLSFAQQPVQPLPSKVGATKIAVSLGGFSDVNYAGNLQGAYAINDLISVGLNGYYVGPERKNVNGDSYLKSFSGEAFIGTKWFKPLKVYGDDTGETVLSLDNGIQIDAIAGYGISNLHSNVTEETAQSGDINGNFKYHTRYAFLQTNLVVKSTWVDVGMSLRGVGMKYIKGTVNGQRFSNRQSLFIDQAEKEGMYAFVETAFRFSAGSSKMKVFTTVSVISNVFGDKSMVHLPKPMMIGIEFNINEFSKKGAAVKDVMEDGE